MKTTSLRIIIFIGSILLLIFAPIIPVFAGGDTIVQTRWPIKHVMPSGKFSTPGAWSDATEYQIALDHVWGWPDRQSAPSDKVLDVRFMNDNQWLYILYQISWPSDEVDGNDSGFIELFPADTSTVSDYGSVNLLGETFDLYGWTGSNWFNDTDAGGQNNVIGAARYDGTSYWFEFKKLLNSGDGFDWVLAPGELVGSPNAPTDYPALMVGIYDATCLCTYEQYISLQLANFPHGRPAK